MMKKLVLLVSLIAACSGNGSGPFIAIDAGEDPTQDGVGDTGGVCSPGERQCFGAGFLTCNDDGSGWLDPQMCPGGEQCVDGLCCVGDCTDRECGSDGCGGSCGECAEGAECVDNECVSEGCVPQCGEGTACCEGECCTPTCDGVQCGSDGCCGNCGECGAEEMCAEGACCAPQCLDLECGDDGCGGLCGECLPGVDCVDGTCCAPECEGLDCGPDGCGGSCGKCEPWHGCDPEGFCSNACTDNCAGKECGADDCGGLCGQCEAGLACTTAGVCANAEECTPECGDKECGSDGCFAYCGQCSPAHFCAPDMKCYPVDICEPDCEGTECGPDGCGGSCGECTNDTLCTVDQQCSTYCSSCQFDEACGHLDFEQGNLFGWNVEGDAKVVSHLAEAMPAEGQFMAVASSTAGKLGSIAFETCIQQPAPIETITFKWRFFSEEFLEFCGAPYADEFTVYLRRGPDAFLLMTANVHDLCPPASCNGCGDLYTSLEESGIVLDKGGVFGTPWQEGEATALGFVTPGEPFYIVFSVEDDYDDDYDSLVLIDDIQFHFCETACNDKDCGPDGCGGSCGECAEGHECTVQGSCKCIASCEGKQCGDDGCGGSCGSCAAGKACDEGLCVDCVPSCGAKECGGDGCGGSCGECGEGFYCAAQGLCLPECVPNCTGKECGDDGCGESCGSCDDFNVCTKDKCDPAMFKCNHLFIEGACDDGDPSTQGDHCVDGECVGGA